jgi:gluconolactonase
MKRYVVVLAALGSLSGMAGAQDAPLEPIEGVIAPDTRVQLVGEGYDGTEGPLPWDDGGLLFTENRAGRVLRLTPDGKSSVHLEQSNGSNSLALNATGELVSVQTTVPRVGVLQPVQAARTLVEGFEGKPFGRPNDLVISRRGDIYFTDPNGTPASLYRLPPGGALVRIAADIGRPNGVALAPDDRVLYVADTAGEWVIAYDVAKNGELSRRRNFAKIAGMTKSDTGALAGGTDGLAVDARGRVYAATGIGVQVFDRKGKALGVIPLPKAPQNLAFAGEKRDQLYVVGRGSVYRIPTLTTGPDRPGK